MIKITGGVDVNKLLEDVNQALQKTKQLGVQGTQNLPSQLTAAQKQAGHRRDQGPEGRDLHRQGRQDPAPHGRSRSASSRPRARAPRGSANINFDLSISDLNKDQTISEPSNAKPFDQLLSQLGGLGLGGLGATGGDRRDRRHLERQRQQRAEQREARRSTRSASRAAGSDVTKARECAKLLTG